MNALELAVNLHRKGRLAEAEAHYRTVLVAFPRHPEALHGIGLISLHTGRFAEAIWHFEQVLAAEPRRASALMGLGDALAANGRQDDATDVLRRLIALEPGNAAAHYALGHALKQLGQFANSRTEFGRAVALEPGNPRLHYALAESAPFTDGDVRLPPLEDLARGDSRFTGLARAELHFALFKAYDDLKRHDEAFAHLAKGNRLWRSLLPYDESAIAAFFASLRQTYTKTAVAALAGTGHVSNMPVFVVGMPRSGTTLVEQILASHPDVFGGGELQYVQDLLQAGLAGPRYPMGLAELGPSGLRQFGGHYCLRLSRLAPNVERIVDKLPANFRHLGLLHLALPQARLIHVARDARDTCFSCYTQLFANGLNYAYDLGELGRYYKLAASLMEHWQTVLPRNAILDVQYESLVADFENEAKRLVAFCGLDWDESCLRFHETQRAVRTKSEFQVRRPLFTTSIGRWRPYERWLEPLFDALA
jgi:tetratricopeptide (TPR) repeat protein